MTKLNITDTAKADIKETLSHIKDTLCNPKEFTVTSKTILRNKENNYVIFFSLFSPQRNEYAIILTSLIRSFL